jgi:manganese/zinc/iron transport system substrate-binding protein
MTGKILGNYSFSKKYTFCFKLLTITVLNIFFLLACQDKNDKNTGGKLKIVCSTSMIADALKNIAGDSAEVIALMGAGVDPHLYKATQNDLEKLQSADIIFYNGLHLEGKMTDVFEKLKKNQKTIAFSEALPENELRRIDEKTFDPHIWFDVKLWQKSVAFAGDELAKFAPKNEAFFRKNSQTFLQKLDELDSEIRSETAKIPPENRILITTHDAFSYFGKAYSIEVKALMGVSTLSEAGLKDVADLSNFIVEKKVKAVFVETTVAQKAFRETLTESCAAKNHPLNIGGELYTDALGDAGSPEGTYIGMMQKNVKTIVNALQ